MFHNVLFKVHVTTAYSYYTIFTFHDRQLYVRANQISSIHFKQRDSQRILVFHDDFGYVTINLIFYLRKITVIGIVKLVLALSKVFEVLFEKFFQHQIISFICFLVHFGYQERLGARQGTALQLLNQIV